MLLQLATSPCHDVYPIPFQSQPLFASAAVNVFWQHRRLIIPSDLALVCIAQPRMHCIMQLSIAVHCHQCPFLLSSVIDRSFGDLSFQWTHHMNRLLPICPPLPISASYTASCSRSLLCSPPHMLSIQRHVPAYPTTFSTVVCCVVLAGPFST